MQIKGFESKTGAIETPNDSGSIEKPLKSEKEKNQRVDINVLKSKLRERENIILKKITAIIFIFFVTASFADTKKVVCVAEDKNLLNQRIYVNFEKKTISMRDKRKIFDIEFSNDFIRFKKLLSIRNLDSLISKKPDYFIFELDIESMNLYVSVSTKPVDRYKYYCEF